MKKTTITNLHLALLRANAERIDQLATASPFEVGDTARISENARTQIQLIDSVEADIDPGVRPDIWEEQYQRIAQPVLHIYQEIQNEFGDINDDTQLGQMARYLRRIMETIANGRLT